MGVSHRERNQPGGRRRHESLGERAALRFKCFAKYLTFPADARLNVANFPNRLGRRDVGRGYRLPLARLRFNHSLKRRIFQNVASNWAFPRSTEPFHAVTDIKKERATLLLAVVTNIDAGGDLADGSI